MQETNIYNSSSFFETEEGEIDGNLNAFLVRPVLDKKPHKVNEFYNHLPE